jgi:hypothetical protein
MKSGDSDHRHPKPKAIAQFPLRCDGTPDHHGRDKGRSRKFVSPGMIEQPCDNDGELEQCNASLPRQVEGLLLFHRFRSSRGYGSNATNTRRVLNGGLAAHFSHSTKHALPRSVRRTSGRVPQRPQSMSRRSSGMASIASDRQPCRGFGLRRA